MEDEKKEAKKAPAKQPDQTKPVEAKVPSLPASVIAATPPKSEPNKPRLFRVKKDKTISWYGSITTMAQGSIVDSHSYGEIGMKRILDQGVELEPIE